MALNIIYADEPTFLNTAFVSELRKRGNVKLYFDRPSQEELRERLKEADIAIAEWSYFTEDTIPGSGRLKHIALLLSGVDTVDIRAMAKRGISVSNCPLYCVEAVSDHIVGCAFALARRFPASSAAGAAGVSHVYRPFLGRELRGATIGLIGVGRIGRAVADRAANLGMRVVGWKRSREPVTGVELMSLDDVIATSDLISIQLPYTRETHGILNAQRFAGAKRDSLWISVGRFRIFCEKSLEAVLREHRIGGIALDDCPAHMLSAVQSLGNAVVTPGTAWYTSRSREANLSEVILNIDHFVAGRNYVPA